MDGSVAIPGDLAHLTLRELHRAFEPHILARGRSYYRTGSVSRLEADGQRLVARVRGSRAQPYHVECRRTMPGRLRCSCTCSYMRNWKQLCKHLAAAMLAWVTQRETRNESSWLARTAHPSESSVAVQTHETRRSAPQSRLRPFLHSVVSWSDFDRELFARMPMAHRLAADFFAKSPSPRAEVTVVEPGPTLLVTLADEQTRRRAAFWIPRDRIPEFVAQCRDATDFIWRGGAAGLKLRRRPATPCLIADYDEHGRLVLTPVYALPGSSQRARRLLAPQDVEAKRVGINWVWEDDGLYSIAAVPARLRPYFAGTMPLTYDGLKIPEFFDRIYRRLVQEVAFRPSAAVRQTKILPPPRLSHVQLDLDGPDWFSCEPMYAAQELRVALRDILAAQSNGPFLRNGHHWIRLPDRAQLLEAWAGASPDEQGRVRLSRLQYLQASAGWDPRRVHVEDSDGARHFRELVDRVVPLPEPPPLDGQMTALRPYQEAGYRWLWFLAKSGFHGLLADEMGLGKTHQAMALLHALQRSGQTRPSLVVCPRTVLDHWEDKLKRHATTLECLRVHGAARPQSLSETALPPVILTTYHTLAKEPALFEPVAWACVILDEAQQIKNPATKAARSAKRLRAEHRVALTGTPIENRPMELWSIFEFLLPGYLGSARSFRHRFEVPIVRHRDTEAMVQLRRLINPFKLRRLKAEVAQELPPKIEDVRFCELTPHQAALYHAAIEQARPLVAGLRDRSKPIQYIHIFAALTRLKRICDHPALVLRARVHRSASSGKLAVFEELLDEALASGQKVVVFSQYLEMLKILAAGLRTRRAGYVVLQGSTLNRRETIARFQHDPSCRVFLGSLLAGGLGVDLTAASVVIHYDRWWNAAREDQATDRVHRIGQARGVQVLKLVTKATLEERIHRMIERKRALMAALVTSDVGAVKAFTREELIELLSARP